MSRYLTKSKFKLGLECPNKLYYTSKKQYANTKLEDPFLKALAQGGFQVEELARLHYPEGLLIEGRDYDHEYLWKATQELLKLENVTIFEAAFLINGLFVRTDILVKKGDRIELIEVKSKSFDPNDDYLFIGKRGGMVATWKPYLFDIAFQKNVVQMCFPDWKISSFIMMADKSKKASIDGLNQLFRISRSAEGRTGIIKRVNSLDETGDSVLGRKNVSQIIDDIEVGKYDNLDGFSFSESIEFLSDIYQNDKYANWPTSYSSCKKCEFQCSSLELGQGKKSGFRECFSRDHGWVDTDFNKPNILDIYDFKKGSGLFEKKILFKHELNPKLIGLKEEADRLTTSHRQWLQIEKEVSNDNSMYADKFGLEQEIRNWSFPLHFIDFETCTAAIPFHKGRVPYEQIAFQYSHHKYHKDGRVEHAAQYINNRAGAFPNFEFVRQLQKSLSTDDGTIFRYSHHENTVLNAIYFQLLESGETDKDELINFIASITHSKRSSSIKWKGERDMVDLWDIEKKYYYNPLTKGSNSIKDVLPASLSASTFLQDKYSLPIGKAGITSLNFPEDHIWLKYDSNQIINPYKMLPPLFNDWSEDQIENTLAEMEEISEGGAAMTAYGKLQYTDMTDAEIEELTQGLLKYCELDTLAMVMIYEHFNEIVHA